MYIPSFSLPYIELYVNPIITLVNISVNKIIVISITIGIQICFIHFFNWFLHISPSSSSHFLPILFTIAIIK